MIQERRYSMSIAISEIAGEAVFEDGVRAAKIRIDGEVISSVVLGEASPEQGVIVFPGFMDLHVHAREYPQPDAGDAAALKQWEALCRKETFRSAGAAALNGGVVLYGAMPNDPVPPDNPADYSRKRQVSSASPCPLVLYAAVTHRSEPWDDLPYKVYLDRRPSAVAFDSWHDLDVALARYRGRRIFFHAEDPDLLKKFHSGGPRWTARPPEAEVSAVRKILDLTAKHGLRSHICHVSTEAATHMINQYNRHSETRVSCEVTPHHLFFSVRDGEVAVPNGEAASAGRLLESNPPLRSEADRRFLIEALREGLVDILASDHAPHTLEDKAQGSPGMPHLDTLGAFAGWLVAECGFSLPRIAEVLSTAAGRIIERDLDLPHGRIAPGYAASFTMLGLGGTTLVENGKIRGRGPLKTRCGWSPFSGISLPASVKSTVARGRRYDFQRAEGMERHEL